MALNSFPCRLGTCSYVCDESTNWHCHRVKSQQLNRLSPAARPILRQGRTTGGWECPEAAPDLPLPPSPR